MKSFANCSIEEVENEFGLTPKTKSNRLDGWLTLQADPNEFEKQW